MISAIQREVIEGLVLTMYEKGYTYYLANTQYRTDNNNPDLIVYFSQKEIKANSLYSYQINGGVKYSINSSNYSTSNNAQRYQVTNVNTVTISINNYEHIFTNAMFTTSSVQPKLTIMEEVKSNEKAESLNIVVIVALLVSLVAGWFRNRR